MVLFIAMPKYHLTHPFNLWHFHQLQYIILEAYSGRICVFIPSSRAAHDQYFLFTEYQQFIRGMAASITSPRRWGGWKVATLAPGSRRRGARKLGRRSCTSFVVGKSQARKVNSIAAIIVFKRFNHACFFPMLIGCALHVNEVRKTGGVVQRNCPRVYFSCSSTQSVTNLVGN